LKFNTKTEADRSAAEAVGFNGTDLTISRTNENIFISSSIAEKNGKITDVSDSVSRVGFFVKLDKALPEDLIVSVRGTQNGQRVLASATSEPIVRAQPRSPDIRIKISTTGDPGQLEIFDAASGASLANRSWRPGEAVNYLDLKFRVNTAARADDEFRIVRDEVRTLDNRNALLISGLRNKTIFEQYGGTFQQAYSLAAAKFGASVQSADYTTKSTKQSASDIKSVLEGKTGVSLDTEASDLIRYQQAYQAAAQVVTAARDMFQTILNVF
jgi:flagellar hook-associated protein FlgK